MLYLITQDERHKGGPSDTLPEALEKCRELQKIMPSWATLYIDARTDNGREKTVRAFKKNDRIK